MGRSFPQCVKTSTEVAKCDIPQCLATISAYKANQPMAGLLTKNGGNELVLKLRDSRSLGAEKTTGALTSLRISLII